MQLLSGKRAADAPPATFEAVVLPHAGAAYNLARYLVGSDEEAKDVTQEAFLRAYRSFDRFEDRNALAWILAIVRNVSYSALERGRNGPQSVEFDEDAHSERKSVSEASFARPEVQFDRHQSATRIRGLIAQLPIEFREVIVLRELEELSYREIAEVLNIPEGTVMSRLSRGRSWLRKLANGEGAGDAV